MTQVPNHGKIAVIDGTGTKTPMLHTGHGAPSATGRGMSTGRLLSNNWGAQSLKKIKMGPHDVAVSGGARATGQDRFVRPTDATTAQIPSTPGLGNPHGERST